MYFLEGNDTFIPHFMRTFSKPKMAVWIDFGVPILDANWEQLLAKTQIEIDEKVIGFQRFMPKNALPRWSGCRKDVIY